MLAGRQKYFHPYEPYSVQLEFMHALYDALEQGSIGIFESPTGTVGVVEGQRFNKETGQVAESCLRGNYLAAYI